VQEGQVCVFKKPIQAAARKSDRKWHPNPICETQQFIMLIVNTVELRGIYAGGGPIAKVGIMGIMCDATWYYLLLEYMQMCSATENV
jgi:hypothetical protein